VKSNGPLILASLLAVLFMTFHVADDIVRGTEKGGTGSLFAVPILVAWLYGALILTGRRSGYVITLLGSLVGTVACVVHFLATGGVAGRGIAESNGALFFVWVLVALGVASAFAFVLSLRGLGSAFAWRGPRLGLALRVGRPRGGRTPS
jgi:hypothetical protein